MMTSLTVGEFQIEFDHVNQVLTVKTWDGSQVFVGGNRVCERGGCQTGVFDLIEFRSVPVSDVKWDDPDRRFQG